MARLSADTSHPYRAKNDVVTKKYLDDRIAAIPEPEIPEASPIGPTTQYDGNRFCVTSNRGTALNEGDWRFMAADGSNVTNIALMQRVGLPASEFDWSKCSKSGVIKVKNLPLWSAGCRFMTLTTLVAIRNCGSRCCKLAIPMKWKLTPGYLLFPRCILRLNTFLHWKKCLRTMAARFPVLKAKTQYYKLPIPEVSEIPPIPEPGIPVPGRDHLKPQPPQLRAS